MNTRNKTASGLKPFRKTLYEGVAERITRMIDEGVYRSGEKVPSVRDLSRQMKVSVTTVLEAYKLLEDRSVITARPQSGYYVNPRIPTIAPTSLLPNSSLRPTSVDNSELSLSILKASNQPGVVPLGAAIPDPKLLPFEKLNRLLCSVARHNPIQSIIYDVPPGHEELRVQISRRSLTMGCSLTPEEIVTTSGCLEAVFLALRATCRPGDIVVVESPTYYNFLLLIQRLNLRALQIPCHPQEGLSLDALTYALQENRVGACLLNCNFNNPTGSLIPEDHKEILVKLLTERGVPLIEDDTYGDLTFSQERPKSTKAFDRDGIVLLCSSFSKTLAPGYRVGWIAAGRYQSEVEQLKSMTNVSNASPTQLAVAEFLANGGYDRHLRKIRRTFALQMARMSEAVGAHFPEGTRISRPLGGFVLWLELPSTIDSMRLHHEAMKHRISIAPGPIFSPSGKYRNCIRLNAGFWSQELEGSVQKLGSLAEKLRTAQ